MSCIRIASRASLALAAVAFAGCAAAPSGGSIQNDQARMNAVEHAARVHGVSVVWINPPRRVVPASGG